MPVLVDDFIPVVKYNGLLTKVVKSSTYSSLDFGTATATSGSATVNTLAGLITTESLTTAAGAVYTLTVNNNKISSSDLIFVSVNNGSNTGGSPTLTTVSPANGSFVVKIQNIHATAAFNGTLVVSFFVVKTT